jgi:hypothetical protein
LEFASAKEIEKFLQLLGELDPYWVEQVARTFLSLPSDETQDYAEFADELQHIANGEQPEQGQETPNMSTMQEVRK